MQTLTFKPYSEKEAIETLINGEPPFLTNFTSFKVSSWFDMPNKTIVFGIKGKMDSKWYNICMAERAIIFADKKLANKVNRHFNNFIKENHA